MGSADEFDRLVGDHARLMSSAIRRVCGQRHQALVPDVEQEVRLALWKQLRAGKKIDHPVSYLYKVALTTALAVLRRQGREDAPLDDEMPEPQQTESASRPSLLPAERSHLLGQVLARLPAPQARALRAYLAGYNHREVAELYDWTEAEARHRIYRGLEALKTLGREATTHGR